jgi:hypothetical protein
MFPGVDRTVYPVIGEPLAAGAEKVTETWPAPVTVAVPMVGASGTSAGVTEFEAAEAAPVPAEFVAVTVKQYATPLARPVTTFGHDAPVPVIPPGFDVTV